MREMKRSMIKNVEATSNAIVTASTKCPRSPNCGVESAMAEETFVIRLFATRVPSDWQRHCTTRYRQHSNGSTDSSAYERRTELLLHRAVGSVTAQP